MEIATILRGDGGKCMNLFEIKPTTERRLLLGLVMAALVSGTALGGPAVEPPGDQRPRSLLDLAPEQVRALQPMVREIRDLLVAEREDLRVLADLLAGMQDPAAALRLQKEIGVRKQMTEISILEVQVKYALARGDGEQARTGQQAIAKLKERLDLPARGSGIDQ